MSQKAAMEFVLRLALNKPTCRKVARMSTSKEILEWASRHGLKFSRSELRNVASKLEVPQIARGGRSNSVALRSSKGFWYYVGMIMATISSPKEDKLEGGGGGGIRG